MCINDVHMLAVNVARLTSTKSVAEAHNAGSVVALPPYETTSRDAGHAEARAFAAGAGSVSAVAAASVRRSRRKRQVRLAVAAEQVTTSRLPVQTDGREQRPATILALQLENLLPTSLHLDGLWLKRGDHVSGRALLQDGVPSHQTREIVASGRDVSLLLWFRAKQWPFETVTLALVRSGDVLRVTSERGRVLLSDARKLFEKLQQLDAGASIGTMSSFTKTGTTWLRYETHDMCVRLVVHTLSPVALVPRSVFDSLPAHMRLPAWSSMAWPSVGALFGWMIRGDQERPPDLQQQLQRSCGTAGMAEPVADARLFQLLGVEPGASPLAVRLAWRRLARDLHPDASRNAETFNEVREAFRILSDPALRSRYEALGSYDANDSKGSDGVDAGVDGIATSLALMLGAWALRPLLGGPLTPPLGLPARSMATRTGIDPEKRDILGAALSAEVRAALGMLDGPEAEAERAAEFRAAIATSERIAPEVVDGDSEAFAQGLRRELRALMRAADGTLAPHLLARWGSAHAAGARAWLRDEAPSPDANLGPAAPSGAAQAAGVALAGLSGVAALPAAAFATLFSPQGRGARVALNAAVVAVVEVVLRTALLEVERRGFASAQRLLDDESKPWQLRWRSARALLRFGEILAEEGDPGDPKIQEMFRVGDTQDD